MAKATQPKKTARKTPSKSSASKTTPSKTVAKKVVSSKSSGTKARPVQTEVKMRKKPRRARQGFRALHDIDRLSKSKDRVIRYGPFQRQTAHLLAEDRNLLNHKGTPMHKTRDGMELTITATQEVGVWLFEKAQIAALASRRKTPQVHHVLMAAMADPLLEQFVRNSPLRSIIYSPEPTEKRTNTMYAV
jgi:histone H3/H4